LNTQCHKLNSNLSHVFMFTLVEELKTSLQDNAKKNWQVKKFFCVKPNIKLARLQMTQQPEPGTVEDVGRFHHREDIPQTVTKDLVGDVSLEEMFEKANQSSTTNLVGVIGQAGIGKTTLSKVILKRAVKKRLFQADYIFYLQFREVDYDEKTNLLSFLAKSLPLEWIDDPARWKPVLKEISESSNVLIIMDGYDEAKFEASSRKIPLINLYASARPEAFLKNILRGSILASAKKIVTSRPRQLLETTSEIRPKFILNILGLGLESQYEICQSICPEIFEQVFSYIQSQPSIATYCYVPSNCILVMHAMQQANEQKLSTPTTISGVIAVVLSLFVCDDSPQVRNVSSKFFLKKLAKLAWTGFVDKKYCFTEKDLKNADLSKEDLDLFMITILLANHTKIFYFTHLIIQEFFSALHLLVSVSLDAFKEITIGRKIGPIRLAKAKCNLTEGRWEMVTKFLFGISNENTLELLKGAFSDISEVVSEKVKILCRFALRILPKSSDADDMYFQKVLLWAHELHNDDFACLIAGSLKEEMIINGKVLPSDVAALNYVLQQRRIHIRLDTTQYSTWFVGDSITRFKNAMKAYKESSSFVTVVTNLGKMIINHLIFCYIVYFNTY